MKMKTKSKRHEIFIYPQPNMNPTFGSLPLLFHFNPQTSDHFQGFQ